MRAASCGLVSGGWGHEQAAANPLIVAHVRRIARESRRIASVCTGASILAAAGLLDGRRVTTHWRWAGKLAARHPSVTVDPRPIYIRDGNLTTSATTCPPPPSRRGRGSASGT
ncbi:hypothetical protein GCM10017600_39610 [Streptosporangium carneum]|uniref:DJ-1/PfpI domain-containing protein n=1 Tax=Streptosporangium carneum TaxID=47481 RepID=A0A9W6ME38_9ACTN|nr:DJ-1/PfpI family protein [Streptosporangium carneum]GLK10555.1 hypothetical protein GCM10017600_39610 [Streptosporangium carneum]